MVEAETLSREFASVDRPCVLVVDDDERLADLLRRQLEASGFEVTVATRAAVALYSIEQSLPDLILLDLVLPDMSGYQLCWTLRQLYPRPMLPIVILTGVEQSTEDLEREAAGADGYLRKPYDAAELIHMLHEVLR